MVRAPVKEDDIFIQISKKNLKFRIIHTMHLRDEEDILNKRQQYTCQFWQVFPIRRAQ